MAVSADLGDVHDFGALPHAKVHRLVSALVEVLKEGRRVFEQCPLCAGTHAELEQAARQPVAVVGLFQQAVSDQVLGHPVHCAFGKPCSSYEFGQWEEPVIDPEGAQDRHRLAKHGVEVRVLLHPISVTLSGTVEWIAVLEEADIEAMTDSTLALDGAVVEAADRLRVAFETRRPCLPIRDMIDPTDVASAYAIQELVNRDRLAAGAIVVGRKIGLTSEAVQRQLGVDQPDFGVLFADMEVDAGAVAPMAGLLQPKVEAEIAFGLAVDLADGDLDDAQIRAAVAWAAPALEIVDSRIRDWDISFADTVADNASSGLFVIGTQHADLAAIDPVTVEMAMTLNGVEVSVGRGSASLGDPVAAVVWLARTAREFGSPLRAGQVVLSGALGPMVSVGAGDEVTAHISTLGSVSVRFGDATEGARTDR